jgi:hypothetical protein
MDRMLTALESDERVWSAAKYLASCAINGLWPDPEGPVGVGKPIIEALKPFYIKYMPIPPGYKRPPSLTYHTLAHLVNWLVGDSSLHEIPNRDEIIEAAKLGQHICRQQLNNGGYYYITDAFYQRTWLVIRSEEAMKVEGEFC